jgi:hypothetical protein
MTNATAAELVADPSLGIDPITAQTSSKKGYSDTELAHFRIGHDDIHRLVLKIYNYYGKKHHAYRNVRHFITDASFEDSIDSTPTFTLVLHDPDWELLNTGALDHNIDLNPGKIPHRWYRLGNFVVNDDDITLTFFTRNAVYLMQHRHPRKSNRKRFTRAQFIKVLLRSVKQTRIRFFAPLIDKKQKIAKTHFGSERERKRSHEKGFTSSDKITVKHRPASEVQRRAIEKVIQAGEDVSAPSLVIVSAVMCIIQESDAGGHTGGNPPFVGPFQQARKYGWPATGDAYKDAKGNGKVGANSGGYYGRAIPAYRKKPNQDLGVLVANVQGVTGSTNPLNNGYAQSANRWRDEAQHAVNAMGVDVSGTTTAIDYKKKYEFMVGPPDGSKHENYLAAIYRLAEEVRWRAFWVNDVLHYQAEDELFKAKARKRLRRFEDGIEHVSFDWDTVRAPIGDKNKINSMTIQVRMERWVAPIGTVVVFDEGGPAQGRWLVTNIRRSMFDELGEITLSKPVRHKLEPANEPGSREPNVPGGPGMPGPGEPTDALGTLADIKTWMTPEYIINHFVAPKAKHWGMGAGTSAASIRAANAAHGGTSATTWHKGPGSVQWAVDMSTGSKRPDDAKDNLAADLIMSFNLDLLANPLATSGYIPGNLTDTYHKGFHFQMIYRTDLGANGGDHYNHVHLGIKREQPFPSRAGSRFPP